LKDTFMFHNRSFSVVTGGLGLAAVISFGQSQQQPPAPPAPMPAVLRNYQPVTAERLKTPEDGDWLSIRRTYDGWGYSPLDQITANNVKGLRPVWVFSTGEAKVHEAAPVVNNGVMFVSTPNNQVIALDVRTGNLLWRYRRPRPAGAVVLHDTNRGVALYGDKVYYAAGEAVLIALDAKTGKEAWTTTVADTNAGYYITLAPLVAGGKVMVGASGGELGIRGFVAAYDPENGQEQWRTYTIPAPGEPGSETWPKGGDQWKTGGGPVWVTGNYDPATNLAYWGVGNGGPWMGDKRPGDNLYVASTIALDVSTGAIKGHFQYNPNESWDWDEVSPPILVDYQRNGRTVKGLIDVARDGYLWFLDRGDSRTGGRIRFIEGKPFVNQNVFKSLDPETGRPDVDLTHKPTTGNVADYCPGAHGGKNWPPIAFSPRTRMIYVPANNNICGASEGIEVEYTPGKGYTGVRLRPGGIAADADHFGEVQAWNVDTGKKVWTHNYAKSPNWGAMLVTGGGLVFSGGTSDRRMRVWEAWMG
jgi:alcohol dehydrogenase (cytochrome c)